MVVPVNIYLAYHTFYMTLSIVFKVHIYALRSLT